MCDTVQFINDVLLRNSTINFGLLLCDILKVAFLLLPNIKKSVEIFLHYLFPVVHLTADSDIFGRTIYCYSCFIQHLLRNEKNRNTYIFP